MKFFSLSLNFFLPFSRTGPLCTWNFKQYLNRHQDNNCTFPIRENEKWIIGARRRFGNLGPRMAHWRQERLPASSQCQTPPSSPRIRCGRPHLISSSALVASPLCNLPSSIPQTATKLAAGRAEGLLRRFKCIMLLAHDGSNALSLHI